MPKVEGHRLYIGDVRPEHLTLDYDCVDYTIFTEATFHGDFRNVKFSDCKFIDCSIEPDLFEDIVFDECLITGCTFLYGTFKNVTIKPSCRIIRSSFPQNKSEFKGLEPYAVAEGDLIVYKKAQNNCIVTLLIPKDAKRSTAGYGKHRAEYAVVVKIENNLGVEVKEAVSTYTSRFVYRTGQIVKPERPFEEDPYVECAPGIHFFLTKHEAIGYY